MSNLMKINKEYIIAYLKRKEMVLLNYNGLIIEPDDIDSDVIIDFHA